MDNVTPLHSKLDTSLRGPLENGVVPTPRIICEMLERGKSPKKIKRKLGLKKQELNKALSIIASENPSFYRIFIEGGRDLTMAFVDACMTPQIIPFLSKHHGIGGIHVNYAGLEDASDQEIFDEAVKSGIGIIVTVDRRKKSAGDMAKIAEKAVIDILDNQGLSEEQKQEQLDKLPIIIRIAQGKESKKKETYNATMRRFNRFEGQIKEIIRLKDTALLTLTEHGVEMGDTYSIIYDKHKNPWDYWEDIRTRRVADTDRLEQKMHQTLRLQGRSEKDIKADKHSIRQRAWIEAQEMERRARIEAGLRLTPDERMRRLLARKERATPT